MNITIEKGNGRKGRFEKKIKVSSESVESGQDTFVLTKKGKKEFKKKGGLLKWLAEEFLNEELTYHQISLHTEKGKYLFEDVIMEVSLTEMKIYFSDPDLFEKLLRTFPCLVNLGMQGKFGHSCTLSIDLGVMFRYEVLIHKIQF